MNNQNYDAWDDVQLEPQDIIDLHQKKTNKDGWDDLDFDEGFWYSAFRTAAQIPQGIAATHPAGLMAGLWEIMAHGEIFDPQEIEQIKMISEREGIPFDEEAYMAAGQKALGGVPTVSNIASKVEEKTGIPLEPQTRLQKGLRFATEATRLAPSNATLRPLKTELPKPILGAGVEATKEALQEAGLPEQAAELASFAILKTLPKGSPSLKVGPKQKASGLTERQFEKLEEPRGVPQKKLDQINEKIEKDFKNISDKIVKESPIGETASNLKNDPSFKQETRDLLNQAQETANAIKEEVSNKSLKKELADISVKNTKGYALNEYDESYQKFMNKSIKDIADGTTSYGKLVEQYRKNNAALSEYFEPGSSKAFNRGKRDALLDNNRAIAKVIEKGNSELSTIFKEGNDRWSKIMDVEAVDSFIDKVFGEKIDFKKIDKFFNQEGYKRNFTRALGEKGFKEFEQLLTDLSSSETPYKMLKVAKKKGFGDLFKTGLGYILHPKIGAAKAGWDAKKYTYKNLLNSILDKPQIGVRFNKGIQDLKKGNFASAEKILNEVKQESDAIRPSEILDKQSERLNSNKEIKRKESLKKFNEKKSQTKEISNPKLIEYKPKSFKKVPNPKTSK